MQPDELLSQILLGTAYEQAKRNVRKVKRKVKRKKPVFDLPRNTDLSRNRQKAGTLYPPSPAPTRGKGLLEESENSDGEQFV